MATLNHNPDEISLDPTQTEAWDDSALVEAWDEAMAEYKKYHSIAATGEDPEVLVKATLVNETVIERQAEEGEEKVEDASTELAAVVQPAKVEDVKAEESTLDLPLETEANVAAKSDAVSEAVEPLPQTLVGDVPFPFAQQHPAGPTMGFVVGGNDENLRNLMMAWYWTGYYTGLREGQQQTQLQPQSL